MKYRCFKALGRPRRESGQEWVRKRLPRQLRPTAVGLKGDGFMVVVFFHFRESFVFSGFAWERRLKPHIRDFRNLGKTTFLSGRSSSKSMIAGIFPYFM